MMKKKKLKMRNKTIFVKSNIFMNFTKSAIIKKSEEIIENNASHVKSYDLRILIEIKNISPKTKTTLLIPSLIVCPIHSKPLTKFGKKYHNEYYGNYQQIDYFDKPYWFAGLHPFRCAEKLAYSLFNSGCDFYKITSKHSKLSNCNCKKPSTTLFERYDFSNDKPFKKSLVSIKDIIHLADKVSDKNFKKQCESLEHINITNSETHEDVLNKIIKSKAINHTNDCLYSAINNNNSNISKKLLNYHLLSRSSKNYLNFLKKIFSSANSEELEVKLMGLIENTMPHKTVQNNSFTKHEKKYSKLILDKSIAITGPSVNSLEEIPSHFESVITINPNLTFKNYDEQNIILSSINQFNGNSVYIDSLQNNYDFHICHPFSKSKKNNSRAIILSNTNLMQFKHFHLQRIVFDTLLFNPNKIYITGFPCFINSGGSLDSYYNQKHNTFETSNDDMYRIALLNDPSFNFIWLKLAQKDSRITFDTKLNKILELSLEDYLYYFFTQKAFQ
ncbi:hypothetical protein [Marinospirillum sp.]|uniref:hypothetical protein n=1 Tax=Marinospirillum sp. TaxID=2183934 RepID=UPI00384E5B19